MTTHPSKSYKLRIYTPLEGRRGTLPSKKRKIYYVKAKVVAFIINFGGKNRHITQCKINNAKNSKTSKLFTEL